MSWSRYYFDVEATSTLIHDLGKGWDEFIVLL